MVSFCNMWRYLFVAVTWSLACAADLPPSCSKPVYCDSELLHRVQMARVYPDSKTFVDLSMKYDQNKTQADFQQFLNDTNHNPTVEQLRAFVEKYFVQEGELEEWVPPDHSTDPAFLNDITDKDLRQFGKSINEIWPILARKVKSEVRDNPEQYSLVPVTHGFIIPGGRFKEIYYWDTFWIIEGLLISGMKDTARGMIENLIELLNKFGLIPNGSRWYYQERSQPPLLTAMVVAYYNYTQDIDFIRNNIAALEKELNYWLDTQAITFNKDGVDYTLLRYYAPSAGPRPESYFEDYNRTIGWNEKARTDFYIDTKGAAESGWDFSSRWFIGQDGSNDGSLNDIQTRYIIPVDLNAIFAGALQNMANFFALLKNPNKAARYGTLASKWRTTIQAVLWDDHDGIWYDYNMKNGVHRKYFYTSNFAPLWQGAVEPVFVELYGPKVLNYLKQSGGLDFPGGIPTSMNKTGEQWDFPNVWPPEVSIVVNALEKMGNIPESGRLAFEIAQTYVRSCLLGFTKHKQMFEKYDAQKPGEFGDGGEYNVQYGFGWSNGVVLEFFKKYGGEMTADDSSDLYTSSSTQAPPDSSNTA